VTNGAQNFVMVGERTNVTGSARFRKLIEANDYAAALEVARQQVESGANIEARALNSVGNTPLGAAVWGDRREVVAYLISRGADVDAKNRFGQSPLHRAIRRGAVEIARVLIEAGADPASEDGEGFTALAIAERQADPRIIGALSRKDLA